MSAFGLPGITGVLLVEVPEGSTLARAGLRKNDVLLEVNGTKTPDAATLLRLAPAPAPYRTLSLGVSRHQKESVFTITP
jgi:S1-C subfamily serine protease